MVEEAMMMEAMVEEAKMMEEAVTKEAMMQDAGWRKMMEEAKLERKKRWKENKLILNSKHVEISFESMLICS